MADEKQTKADEQAAADKAAISSAAADQTWIVYTDADGKSHRVTIEAYQRKGL